MGEILSANSHLEKFVLEYSERAFQFARGLCGDSEQAKELVQEAFFRVFRKWDQYDASRPLDHWFCTILKNVYFDSLKRYERRHGISIDAPLSRENEGASLSENLPDSSEEEILSRLGRAEVSGEVRAALDDLKTEYKAILTLCDMEGMSYEEISSILECPLGTVRSRLSRARAAFKKRLLERSGDLVVSL